MIVHNAVGHLLGSMANPRRPASAALPAPPAPIPTHWNLYADEGDDAIELTRDEQILQRFSMSLLEEHLSNSDISSSDEGQEIQPPHGNVEDAPSQTDNSDSEGQHGRKRQKTTRGQHGPESNRWFPWEDKIVSSAHECQQLVLIFHSDMYPRPPDASPPLCVLSKAT